MYSARKGIALLLAILLIAACEEESKILLPTGVPETLHVPQGFPEIPFPEGNAWTKERWLLGKKLFFDPALSIDSTISCASCHKPALAFADNTPTTPGVLGRPGTRNVPSLANVAYHPYLLREGGVPTLEMQVLVPISEHNEFGFNLVKIIERLNKNTQYRQMAKDAYGRELDAFVITRSIGVFERSILSGGSRYDAFVRGKESALTPLEKSGMALFFSARTQCSNCHTGFLFTDFQFANNGLHLNYADPGRFRLTGKDADLHLFKTPGLRNSGLTPPYMHDGSLSTLEAVVDHYNMGGKGHARQSPFIRPLNLSPEEKEALVAFLRSLDDVAFTLNPEYYR